MSWVNKNMNLASGKRRNQQADEGHTKTSSQSTSPRNIVRSRSEDTARKLESGKIIKSEDIKCPDNMLRVVKSKRARSGFVKPTQAKEINAAKGDLNCNENSDDSVTESHPLASSRSTENIYRQGNLLDGQEHVPESLGMSRNVDRLNKANCCPSGIGQHVVNGGDGERKRSVSCEKKLSRTNSVQSKARRKLFQDSSYAEGFPGDTPSTVSGAQLEDDDSEQWDENLKTVNLDLRDQVSKLRYQLEAQKGKIKHILWQKVLDIRKVRQVEQKKLMEALNDQREKLDKEKSRDLESLRSLLILKCDADLQKLARYKDTEINKLRMELSSKETMLQRLLGDNRHARLKLNIDDRKSKLVYEIKVLRKQKKELEESLTSASSAERAFSDDFRRNSQSFELELSRVKRQAQFEMNQMIEQLKNKDKLISQLEKDLGQQWVAAQLSALERETGEGARSPTMSAPSHALGVLPEDSVDPTTYFWTPTSASKPGGVEDGWSNGVHTYTNGKQDLPKKLKDLKQRNKELVEKCRAYLQRTKELTAQNRAYKDSSDKMLHENKKMQELIEHSKLRVLQLTRQMNEQSMEKTGLPAQTALVEELKKEIIEDKKLIQALRQACSEKDRRIELIQHRKRRRCVVSPAEKTLGIKETIFGYDEDKSMESDASISSVSQSTLSEEDSWNHTVSTEETERSYQRLMLEQLQLQRSHALLQKQSGNGQDPQREIMAKITLQNDLFQAQCRIETLEQLINDIGEGEVIMLLKERETILSSNREATEKASFWEAQSRQLQLELNKALEKSEDLEFQLMELENVDEGKKSSLCNQECQCSFEVDHELVELLLVTARHLGESGQEMDQLCKEISSLVKGREADDLLRKFDRIRNDEKKHTESLESMARELQMKVISLQKEKDTLQDKISQSQKGQKPGKGDSSASAAREKQENLELKAELTKLINSENKLLEERIQLLDELNDWKTQYEYLKQQLDLFTQTSPQQQRKASKKENSSNETSSPSASPDISTLSRKPSKDRKSKSRSGDDPTQSKRRKSNQDDSSDSKQEIMSHSPIKTIPSFENLHEMTDAFSEVDSLKVNIKSLKFDLQNLKEENINLKDHLRQSALEKSSEAEADQQLLLDKVAMLKSELELVKKENAVLCQRLKQRVDEFHDSQEELNPRVTELEDYCEDLQERLHAAEMAERQAKEKLRLLEGSIDEAESSEMVVRERYERLMVWEEQAKKQIRDLQRNVQELKEIVLDKDFVEQALREKIDFLQKCEVASVRRIEELEAIERDLREQLEAKSDPKCQRELNKIQELKHQITFLETDNKALAARVTELEENEEILRENWRRVADEDYNRTQSLEEKVKMLELMNRELKAKLVDAQEYFVINVSPSQRSLAAELAHSQSSLRDAVTESTADGAGDKSSDSVDGAATDQEKLKLMDKLKKLKRQLSDVAEKKDSKIEALQEKIVGLKETELKLSETISEMEMTERELRAKLALYESSEVTVEKMLKYQSKIEELRTSQESLLDQLESLENQEMTLQEKMQEMERTLRGKIVTLEVEMKGYKQKELKSAARIRELEKQEKELSEKVAQQAEKENSLYVKISALMDELKSAKDEVENLKSQMAGKEDKIRKAKLLEVKLLEIEMEYGKKISDISSKLRRKEEELRQKDAVHEEEVTNLQNEISSLQTALTTKESEKNRRIAILEKLFAQKESDFVSKIASLDETIKEFTNEKSTLLKQIQDLKREKSDIEGKDSGYQQEMDILRQEVVSIKTSEKEYEETIAVMEGNFNKEKQRADVAEEKVVRLEKDLAKEKRKVSDIEVKLIAMKQDIEQKMKTIEANFVEKETEHEKELDTLQEELELKDKRVKELEGELELRAKHVNELEAKIKSKAAHEDHETKMKVTNLEKEKNELEKKLIAKEKTSRDEISALVSSRDEQIKELQKKVHFLSTQLLHEATSREQLEKSVEESKINKDTQLSKLSELHKEIEQHKQELVKKLEELEAKNKEMCELSLELSNLRYSNKSLMNDYQNLKEQMHDSEKKFLKQISEKDEKLQQLNLEIQKLQGQLSQKDEIILKASEEDKILQEKNQELSKKIEETSQKDQMVQETIQKSEQMLLLSQKEKDNKDSELENLRKDVQRKDQTISQYLVDLEQKNKEIQSLHSQMKLLQSKLSEMDKSLTQASLKADSFDKDLMKAKLDQEQNFLEIKQLKQELDKKQEEMVKKSSEQTSTQSLISAKQQELEQAKTELHKCLEEIQEYKKLRDQDKDQMQSYRKLSTDYEQLSQQYEEQSVEHKHLEFKVADVELKLVEAENRYRELEAKCASLEVQLAERFAQSQQADHILKLKDEELVKLETKLVELENECKQASDQVSEAERVIIIKDKEFKLMKAKLETVGREYDELKMSVDKKNEESLKLKDDLIRLRKDFEVVRKEAEHLQQYHETSQSEQNVSQSEINELKQQVSMLQKKYEDTNNNLKASDEFLHQADQSFKSLENKCKETEAQLKVKEKLVEDLEKTLKDKNKETDHLQADLKDKETKCVELKVNLSKADKDYKEKCAQLDCLEAKCDKTHAELKSSEDRCDKLEEKLVSAEKELQEKQQVIQSLSQKITTIEDALKEKESFCRDSQSDFDSLKHTHLELKIECETLKSKLNYFQQMLAHSQSACEEKEGKIKTLESALSQSHSSLQGFQQNISSKETSYNEMVAQLNELKKDLKKSQEDKVLLESQLKQLTVETKQVIEENKSLNNIIDQHLSELKKSTEKCENLQAELEAVRKQFREQETLLNQFKDKCDHLELDCQKLQQEKQAQSYSLSNLESSKQETLSTIQKLEGEKRDLCLKLQELELSLNSKEGGLSELIETNQNLSGMLYRLEAAASESERKCKQLEQSREEITAQKDEAINDVQKFKANFIEVSEKYESVKCQLEDQQLRMNELLENNANLQNSVSIAKEHESFAKQEQLSLHEQLQQSSSDMNNLEAKCSAAQEMNNELQKTVSELKRELSHLKEENVSLSSKFRDAETALQTISKKLSDSQSEVKNLLSENEKMKHSVAESDKHSSKSPAKEKGGRSEEIKESKITVTLAPVQTMPNPGISKEQELAEKLHSLEIHHEETISKMEKLLKDIESYKSRDNFNQEKIKSLDKSLKEMREKDKKMSERVTDLEAKEKQLLEQMADIETTVIVPLETENQELKDELNVVKQEKDEAQAKGNKWNEDELPDIAGLHKSLEDALIVRDEMEKKMSILAEEIKSLQEERENLTKALNISKAAEGELMDKMDFLEDEVERLKNVEQQKSVIEEHLMDRVLDLEEREKVLQEKILSKSKLLNSQYVQTDDAFDEGLLKKCDYLQQKNEVLQDAESRYMDKIVELENMNSRLLVENGNLKATLSSSEEVKSTSACLVSSPNKYSTVVNIGVSGTKPRTDESFKYINTSDLILPSEQAIVPESLSLHPLSNDDTSVLDRFNEMTSKIEYLENKIVLLQDSEAKLMEKMTEDVDMPPGNADNAELMKKMDHLLEENEFLAESVESYKKLYKDEKEKVNELQDRIMEESSIYQDYQESQSRLRAAECMVEEVQAEYEEQLSEREEQIIHLNKVLSVSQQRENELQGEVNALKEYLESHPGQQGSGPSVESLKEELEQQIVELRRHHELREQDLRKQIELLQAQEKESQSQHRQEVLKLEHYIQDLRHHEHELLKEVDILHKNEKDLLEREKQLQRKVDSLEHTRKRDEDSVHNDSSSDEHRIRPDHLNKTPAKEVFSSKITLTLAKSSTTKTQASLGEGQYGASRRGSTPPPHKVSPIQSPISKKSPEELGRLVEELQNNEASLKSRIYELESLQTSDLSRKVQELEVINQNLQRKLRFSESKRAFQVSPIPEKQHLRSSLYSGDSNNNTSDLLDSGLDATRTMLDKPENVLLQRIKDLEAIDKHNKTQLSEIERDREVLHELTRKDKVTIHDLQVKIRELQLSERGLKEQINNLEISEGSLYTKCENLEVTRQQLEDRMHELEIHERRLRELVRRLKLNEEHWLSKSGGMESAVAELSAAELHLKRHLQDVEMEKGGLSERAEYLEARVRELENVEITLMQRIKNYEINEVNLKNHLGHLENSEAAAHSKAYELDVVNVDLSQRLQKAVEECAMLSQHISQLQGQVQDLDRRLLSSKDSEIAYRQHVETLEKNENLVQKKVREFELREIDSQAKIRELEQTNEILNDKIAVLQRSENKLKFRIQELEETLVLDSESPDKSQKHKVPQKLEDCQKYIRVLQQQIENLQQQQLQQIFTSTKTKEGEVRRVSISLDEYSVLQKQSALLEETTYQLEEVEREKEELSANLLQLRQGKGACGHEVEIEVLKRRLVSYKTLFHKLKFSLSTGQATSLLESGQDSDPQGETLPADQLHQLESERVLQSICGIQDGKAQEKDAQQLGTSAQERGMVQSTAKVILLTQPTQVKAEQSSHQEESHWKAIEARKPKEMSGSWGGATDIPVAGAKQAPPPRHSDGCKRSSTPELEEVTVAFHLQSESELSSHHRTQNDTDSSDGPVPPPRRGRVHRVVKSSSGNFKNNGGHESSGSMSTDTDNTARSTAAANKKHYFGNEKSLPSSANAKNSRQQSKPAPLASFGEDSFYLPSSTQEGADSLDDGEAPPLPTTGPPPPRSEEAARSEEHARQERRDSLEDSMSGMSIRERIAMIEKQLQNEKGVNKADTDQMFYWKKKSSENLRQVEVLEKDNKYLKEDLPPAYRRKEKINRLEKELEDKRRYIHLLEVWLSNLNDLLKNKTKQTDREMLEYLQLDLLKLRNELTQAGYRQEDAVLDAAALKTELERKDRDIVSKRNEIEGLVQKLRQSQEECHSIELMRRNALDSLRSLEKEVIQLQDAETQLSNAKVELQTLKKQLDVKCLELHDALSENEEFKFTLEKTIIERDRLKCELKTSEEMKASLKENAESLKKEIVELNTKIEEVSSTETRNSNLAEHINRLNELLATRTEKMQEVYTENLQLRERVHQSDSELIRLRHLCDDYNNLSARFDEVDNYKKEAMILVHKLKVKVERLSRKCQEKDNLLGRLGADLRRTSYRPSSALEELTKLEHVMAQEEYNMEFPVNGQGPQRPVRNKRSSSLDDLDYNYPSSDTDSTSSVPIVSSRPKHPPPYMASRPRSAENFSSASRARGGIHRPRGQEDHQGLEKNLGQFVAIADYDPAIFSQSGRPGLELELREGDAVLITGPMDRTGYYEAEVNGRTGLVPANYLQPLSGSMHLMNHEADLHAQHGLSSKPRHVLARPREGANKNPRMDNNHNGQPRSQVPDPPQSLRIKGKVGDRGLLLSWLPPKVDARGCTKGFQLLGYLVYVNNQAYEQIPNPNICEFILEDVNMEGSLLLAVQSLCAGGHVSTRAELVLEGIVKVINSKDSSVQVEGQEDMDTDLSSVLSSVHYKRGHRKAVMALYDYNPKQQSPHDYTSFELAFQAGDVIYVYGEPRPDGFFHGEVDGKRGLVPACFVEELSKIDKPGMKPDKDVTKVK